MMFIRAVLVAHLAGALVFSPASIVLADEYCGPGKRVGAENDGVGKSWKCVPDIRSGSAVAGAAPGNDTASRILLGVGIVGIIGALAAQTQMTDGLSDIAKDSEHDALKSRESNRNGIARLRQGDFTRAALHFSIAAKYADIAGNSDERDLNRKNASLARAQDSLKEGLAAEQAGKLAQANKSYLQAMLFARSAGAEDLVEKIAGHNDSLAASAGSQPVKPTQTHCKYINNKFTCK